MSQFLYFIPGIPRQFLPRTEVAATFAASALRDLLRSGKTWNANSITFNPLHQNGPHGQLGTIFAALPGGMAIEGFSVDYLPDEQTWIQIGNASLGWYTNSPPTEASLRKTSVIAGYPVVLNDDAAWMAPTIRCQPVGSRVTLPQSIGLGSAGRVIRTKPQYQFWQDLVDCLWNYRFGEASMTNGELWDAAGELLSLNYRIGPKEVDALGLFELLSPESEIAPNWFQIVEAAYDWPIIQELMNEEASKKKSLQGASEASAGSGAETQSTAV